MQRLKDARNEAQKEIENLKREKADEYAAYEKNVMAGLETTFEEYAKETTIKLEQVKSTSEQHKEQVVKELLNLVMQVEPAVHPNAELRMKKTTSETL